MALPVIQRSYLSRNERYLFKHCYKKTTHLKQWDTIVFIITIMFTLLTWQRRSSTQ